jgi:hypothetical protein
VILAEDTVTVRPAAAEKPGLQNGETKQQHHAVSDPCRYRLTEVEYVDKNDNDEHDDRKKEDRPPRDPVAKKTSRKLHKTGVANKTHCYESEPWDDH